MKDDDVISLPIDEVVRKTFETVQRNRNRIRRQLVRNEIKESREGVLGGATACDVDNDSGTLNSTTSQKRRRSNRHHASSVARDVNDCREITTTFITTAMDDRWIGKCCNAVMKKSNSYPMDKILDVLQFILGGEHHLTRGEKVHLFFHVFQQMTNPFRTTWIVVRVMIVTTNYQSK